tara:strand:- start:37 stop:264 length:228 start_codon:yes stop_codon:yes gene_type:complete
MKNKRINLWKRLKPEYKKTFNKQHKEKSYTRSKVKQELKATFFFTEVTYGTAYDIMSCNNLSFFGDAFETHIKYE